MALHHMLPEGICLLIVCASVLSLALPVDETPLTNSFESWDTSDHTQSDEIIPTETTVPIPETEITNVTIENTSAKSEGKISSPNGTTTSTTVTFSNISTSTTNQNVTKAVNAGVNSTESSLTTTSPTPTRTEASKAEGTAAPDEDKSTGGNEKDSVIIKEKGEEYRFWWSDSTWLSVVIPVSVGLASALLLICWICCFRWLCCRRCGRWRAPPYKKRIPKSSSGPAKKALREDFRQLRAKDRMKLLAESSDEEF